MLVQLVQVRIGYFRLGKVGTFWVMLDQLKSCYFMFCHVRLF